MPDKQVTLIFDFDNTLVKSKIDFPKMKIHMARVAKEHGLDFGLEEEIPHKFTAGNIIDQTAAYDNEHGTNLAEQLWKIVEDYEREGMERLTIDDDVFTTLEELKQLGIPMTILTNNSRQPTIEVLERYSIDKYFDLILAREDVLRMKPDKEGIDKILEALSWDRDSVIFIGDSWVDGAAAKNANVRFILFRDELLDAEKYGIIIWKHLTKMKDLLSAIS
jgi:phosphoglycolate phosphatase